MRNEVVIAAALLGLSGLLVARGRRAAFSG
jgi:hypothetical protein